VYMNSTGQSANVFSRHYSDMVAPFENGEYYSMNPNRPGAK
jgi:penicillin G amidase